MRCGLVGETEAMGGGPFFDGGFLLVPFVPEAPRPCVLCKAGSMLQTQCMFSVYVNSVVLAFVVPALRKVREGRGTHFIADAGDIKSLGHPPGTLLSGL